MELICPSCGSEYLEGITRCRSCEVDLVKPLPRNAVALSVHNPWGKSASAGVFLFPPERCCNCGKADLLRIIDQDTRLTRYFMVFGYEYSANFALPFCRGCERARSAGRRRSSTGCSRPHSPPPSGSSPCCSSASARRNPCCPAPWRPQRHSGVITAAIWYISERPGGRQTSYYQPVRMKRIERTRGNAVAEIRLVFTNQDYLHRFRTLNAQAVADGRVIAEHGV
jgi:hypothetical protein